MSRSLNESHGLDGAAFLVSSARTVSAVRVDSNRRLRRRDLRSQCARLRRALPKHSRTLPGTCFGESKHDVSDSLPENSPQRDLQNNSSKVNFQISGDQNGLLIFLINIQCLLVRIPELCHHLEAHRPHIVCIQETWLDKT